MVGVAEFIGLLASLATLWDKAVSLWEKSREPKTEESSRIIQLEVHDAISMTASLTANLTKATQEVETIIDQELLDALTEKLNKAKKRLEDAIKDPSNTLQDLKKEREVARSVICEMLDTIKDHNRGQLPDKNYENLYESFRC